jgi:hypothetical protein
MWCTYKEINENASMHSKLIVKNRLVDHFRRKGSSLDGENEIKEAVDIYLQRKFEATVEYKL